VASAGGSEQRLASGTPAAAGCGVPSNPGGHVLTDGCWAGRYILARVTSLCAAAPEIAMGIVWVQSCAGTFSTSRLGTIFRHFNITLSLHWVPWYGPKVHISSIWAIDVDMQLAV
jgi:hypothetical protein